MKRRSFLAVTGLAGPAIGLSACSNGSTGTSSGGETIDKDTSAELTLF